MHTLLSSCCQFQHTTHDSRSSKSPQFFKDNLLCEEYTNLYNVPNLEELNSINNPIPTSICLEGGGNVMSNFMISMMNLNEEHKS